MKVLRADNCIVLADPPEVEDEIVAEMEVFRVPAIKTARDGKMSDVSTLPGFTLDAQRRE